MKGGDTFVIVVFRTEYGVVALIVVVEGSEVVVWGN